MNIRYAAIADAKILSERGAKTFRDTFTRDNTPENMESYPEASFSPDIQRRELSEPDLIFLIAESGVSPIGYAQLVMNSFALGTDPQNDFVMEMALA